MLFRVKGMDKKVFYLKMASLYCQFNYTLGMNHAISCIAYDRRMMKGGSRSSIYNDITEI